SAHAELVGTTVRRLGGQPADGVAQRIAALSGADNAWGARERSGLLSNAATLKALGVLSSQGTLSVEVVGPDGPRTLQLTARHSQWGDAAWMQRGEMFGPPGIPVVSAFRHLTPLEFRKGLPWLPLHLRNRIPIWFTWLPDDSVLYVQSNF